MGGAQCAKFFWSVLSPVGSLQAAQDVVGGEEGP